MDTPGTSRDREIIRYVSETPWAIRPYMLVTIKDLIAFHASGGKLTNEQITERVGAASDVVTAARAAQPKQGSIVVLPLTGVIAPHADLMTEISGGTALDSWTAAFQSAVNDPAVATIVLAIDSPGGSVEGVAETAKIIREANRTKEVVAVAFYQAGSAAYWLMSQAGQLFVPPSGMVGSIGAYAAHQDISKALEMEGVKMTLIAAGEHKVDGNPFEPLSDEARADIQHKVDTFYNMFVSDVAKGRGVSTSAVLNGYGQGRMLTAGDALAAGMVDGIATLDETIARLLKGRPATRNARAEIEDAPIAAAELEPGEPELDTAFTESIANAMGGSAGGYAPVGAQVTSGTIGIPGGSSAVIPGGTTIAVAAPTGGPIRERGTEMEGERPKTIAELLARQDECKDRQEELNREYAGAAFTDEAQAEFDQLEDEYHAIGHTVTNIREREAKLVAKSKTPANVLEIEKPGGSRRGGTRPMPENLFDVAGYRNFATSVDDLSELYREGAKRANEHLDYAAGDDAAVRGHVERLLSKDTRDAEFAQRILGTGNPLYDRAFGKMVMGRPLTSQEDNAIKAAISNTGLGSETPVPVTIDPTVILTSDGQSNPLRRISRVVTITGNKWQGISSDGVTVEYEAELTAVDPQTPNFTAPKGEVAKAQAEVQFSIEVDQDWPSLRENLAVMFQDAKDAKEAEKFLFGTGTNEPQGIIDALQGTASEIDTGDFQSLQLSDLDLLVGALPPRFAANAQWVGNRGTFSALRALASGRTDFWVPLAQGFADRPQGNTGYALLDYPVNVASGMSALVDTAGEDVLIIGDFQKGFVILDRVGLNVELDPLVRDSNGKLIGARALYVYFRNTSVVTTINAFRMLRIEPSS